MAEHVGTHVWHLDDRDFGGFSGIEMAPDGQSYTALSDRGTLWWGSVLRDAGGGIRDLTVAGSTRLRSSRDEPLLAGRLGDAEGLAIAADGGIWVSFEGLDRIARYAGPDAPAERIASPPEFKHFVRNAALEALAITPDGTILTLPEHSTRPDSDFPVWRYRDGTWDQPFTLPRDGDWSPVGADLGPDGRFYLLERRFQGIRGFASRVRRFDLAEDGVSNPGLLLETTPLQYDNLEGISVWDDGTGIRITMISDDNFFFVQRTEVVEYRVRD